MTYSPGSAPSQASGTPGAQYYYCDYAWLGGNTAEPRVTIEVRESSN